VVEIKTSTKMNRFHILILDDDPLCLGSLSEFLEKQGFKVYCAKNQAKAFSILEQHTIDFFFCDISMPEMSGLDVLKKIKQRYPGMDVIMISGIGKVDQVIKSFRMGAIDYINKPARPEEIIAAIERTDKFNHSIVRKVEGTSKWSLIPESLIRRTGREFIGRSSKIRQVLKMAMLASAENDINVLVTGENGTGKEIIARIIHFTSDRKNMMFYPVNCAAIPDTLIESEFFGHKKGTFTGAIEDRKGCFELSDEGTLFLDEISEMPIGLQAKLLRAIEEKKIKPLGSAREICCNFRIISATNCDPDKLLDEKKLRIDLFHRLSTVIINIPPLRERQQDITPLACYFANQISERRKEKKKYIHPDVFPLLKSYPFPGNVRELRNIVERAMLLAHSGPLLPEHFTLPSTEETLMMEETESLNMEENEKRLIIHALMQCHSNITKAAQLLGISRDTLIRKKKKYNISNHQQVSHMNGQNLNHHSSG
jgi:DNA-binding NtrC family response regulator